MSQSTTATSLTDIYESAKRATLRTVNTIDHGTEILERSAEHLNWLNDIGISDAQKRRTSESAELQATLSKFKSRTKTAA